VAKNSKRDQHDVDENDQGVRVCKNFWVLTPERRENIG